MQDSRIPDLNDVSKAAEAMAEQLRKSLAGDLRPLVALLEQVLVHHEALAKTYVGLLEDARHALQYFGSTGSVAADGPPVRKMTVQ